VCVCIHAGAMDAVGGGGGRRALSCRLSLSPSLTLSLELAHSPHGLSSPAKSRLPRKFGRRRGRWKARRSRRFTGPGSHGNALRVYAYIHAYIYIICTSIISRIYIHTRRSPLQTVIYNTPPPPPLSVGLERRSATPPTHPEKPDAPMFLLFRGIYTIIYVEV